MLINARNYYYLRHYGTMESTRKSGMGREVCLSVKSRCLMAVESIFDAVNLFVMRARVCALFESCAKCFLNTYWVFITCNNPKCLLTIL